jgi:thiamine pyrophosphate-dependent acetolactate synthase large subunit-like protein
MSALHGPDGAAALVRALVACDVRVVFGLPGTQNFAVYSALKGSPIRAIVPTHELAASFMAGAYGRVRGDVGVLLTIPGPGFAYALPGLAEAWLDSAPLVHITNAAPGGPHRKLLHQAIDQRALARPIVKDIIGVSRVDELDAAVRAARDCARRGEPGPVLVELGVADAPATAGPRPATPPGDAAREARAIWQRIGAARRPVLLLGQGCAGAAAAAGGFVERTATPFFTSASGRGVIPENSPFCLGFDPLRQAPDSLNACLASADLVVAVGARLAHNGTAGFGIRLPADRLVHVDAAAESLNATYAAALTAQLSAEEFFAMPECALTPRSAWSAEEVAAWRARVGAPLARGAEPSVGGVEPARFFAGLRAALPDEAMLVTDTGLHQGLARRYYESRAVHGLLMPTDLQSMGFGLPAAIAAKLAAPGRPVVAVIGDGGALISGLELATAVRERIAVTVLVFNDGYLNQIRLAQLADTGVGHGVALPAVDFAALAAAVGARYVRADAGDLARLGPIVRGAAVTLVEVAVGDSAAVRRDAALARTRAAARSVLGPRLTALAKRLLRR